MRIDAVQFSLDEEHHAFVKKLEERRGMVAKQLSARTVEKVSSRQSLTQDMFTFS